MPCINCYFSQTVSSTEKEALKLRMGESITLLAGKTEQYLMVIISDNNVIYFRGNDQKPAAYIEVNLFARQDISDCYNAFSAQLCELFHEILGLEADRIYIKYSDTKHWGWNGRNF